MYKLRLLVLVCLTACCLSAQETRSTISGRVLDAHNAAIVGAGVRVTNTGTNVTVALTTNDTGYYEAALLLPGTYEVAAEAQGFRTAIRKGITLLMSAHADVDMHVEVGGVAESVTVVAEAPMLERSSSTSGRVFDNRTQQDLPVSLNSVTVLARLVPGVQSNGEVRMLGPADQGSSSDYHVGAGLGSNQFYLDGATNSGGTTVGHLPHADTVEEMKVETSGFDASFGQSLGVGVTVVSKSGTNRIHGSASDEYQSQRWNATDFFTRQHYYNNLAAARASGNQTLIQQASSAPLQPPGHENYWAGTVGGPVVIPKVLNGRNKLFFFADYVQRNKIATVAPASLNHTFPTLSERTGDFTDLLKVGSQYQIYDPLTVRADPARSGHYVRDPIPGNILPASRIVNPANQAYLKFLPAPNNNPAPGVEPFNNYLAIGQPQDSFYKSAGGRVDYNISSNHRLFSRYTWDRLTFNTTGDWAFQIYPGLMANDASRHNNIGVLDYVYTPNATTVIDVSASTNQYWLGANFPGAGPLTQTFKPSDVGLPAYLDAHAGDQHILPLMSVGGYQALGPTGFPAATHNLTRSLTLRVSHIHGRHSLQAGTDIRVYDLTGGGGGNTSGSFSFSNNYTRKNDDTFTPAGTLGLSWEAFLMGLPDTMNIAYTDSYAVHSPYYGWFGQDNWRVTPKLNVTLGLRAEFEGGPAERYNRMQTYFDSAAILPIGAAAQAAYARNPVPERSASSFLVQGGPVYAGTGDASRKAVQNQLMWMPRLAAAYQVNPKTVLRSGYGIFYDTLSALQYGAPTQTGYSRTTSTNVTNDFGVHWLAGDPQNGVSPMTNPFPVRADGTRYDAATQNLLGPMANAGSTSSFDAFDTRHARQQRWRAGLQRQITQNMMVEAA